MLKNFWGITGRTLIKISKEHPWVKRIKVIQMKGPCHWRHWLQNKSSVYMYMYWLYCLELLIWAMISKGLCILANFHDYEKRRRSLFLGKVHFYDTCIINMPMHPFPQDPHLWTFLHDGRCFLCSALQIYCICLIYYKDKKRGFSENLWYIQLQIKPP